MATAICIDHELGHMWIDVGNYGNVQRRIPKPRVGVFTACEDIKTEIETRVYTRLCIRNYQYVLSEFFFYRSEDIDWLIDRITCGFQRPTGCYAGSGLRSIARYLRIVSGKAKCGVDFCGQCGDCLYCYGNDPCGYDGGDHSA